MKSRFIPFDKTMPLVKELLEARALPDRIDRLYLVRDLFGKLRISVSDTLQEDAAIRAALQGLAGALHEALGARGYPAEDGVLFVGDALLATLDDAAQEIHPKVFLADRLVTGRGWWTVGASGEDDRARRITLYSVKGGVGRSTTAAVLAWHLARRGERVLAVDMDLESPGLSSAMIEPERRPQFGVADWFVEDLVGQGDRVWSETCSPRRLGCRRLTAMSAWHPHTATIRGEYLAKLGRVYMDMAGESWTKRLDRLLDDLEAAFRPTVVLLESRSGLHDIAAATVTDLNAEVLLFATDAESTWTDYDILFRHWNEHGLARLIRERLSVVSALTPVPDREAYLQRFQSRAWDLFRDCLYDEMDAMEVPGDNFSFDLDEADAPHTPMEISWTLGFSAGASLRNMDEETVRTAYGRFLKSFEERVYTSGNGDTS